MRRCRRSGKIRYRDRIGAQLALASALHADSSRRPKLEKRAYRCPACGGWHLTSMARRLPGSLVSPR